MALIECPKCGGKVSDKATLCPHCGCPIEQVKRQSKICPECGQEVDVSERKCPNCAFPFTSIEENSKPLNVANTIQNGKLIIEVDNPIIPLLASISIKIGGEKVAECHKGDIIELPIEKDCEVSFKWNMAFTSVSIYAMANEVKRLFIGFDSTNIQIFEEVLGQVGEMTEEANVVSYIPEPIANKFAGQQAYNPEMQYKPHDSPNNNKYKQDQIEYMTCKACGTVIRKGLSRCPTCGSIICRLCGTAVAFHHKCPNCGCPNMNYKASNIFKGSNNYPMMFLPIIAIIFLAGWFLYSEVLSDSNDSYTSTSSTNPSYWVGTWTSDGGQSVDREGNYRSHKSDNPITFTFNSNTMTVHVNLGSMDVEYDKEWAIIPDGSGVTFFDINGETVSILAPDGKWYHKDLNTGRVSEVGMILRHIH